MRIRLAQGKYPIYMTPRQENYYVFAKAGVPIAAVETEDIMRLGSGASAVSLIDKALHPNSSGVFIN